MGNLKNKVVAVDSHIATLKPCAMGMSLGVLSGLSLFVMAMIAGNFEWGGHFISTMSSVYVGYNATLIGAIIGFGWGFLDGVICGGLFAMLYNFFCGCRSCSCILCKCCSKCGCAGCKCK